MHKHTHKQTRHTRTEKGGLRLKNWWKVALFISESVKK